MQRFLRTFLLVATAAAGVVGAVWVSRWWWQPPPLAAPPPRWPVVVTTLAGGGAPGAADGAAAGARFSEPFGVAADDQGLTYLSDAGDNNAIRRIAPDGTVTQLAGGHEGFADGDASSARFSTPSHIAVAPSGLLIVADTGNHAIRSVAPDGRVATIAGDGVAGFADGSAGQARFDGPIGVAVAADGVIYVADSYNDRIRRIDPDGRVSTVAGGSGMGYRDGTAAEALFDTPTGLAVGERGELFVADTGNDVIRRVAPDGEVSTFGGTTPVVGQAGGRAALFRPIGVAAGEGLLYVTDGWDRVVVFSSDGRARELAGGGAGFANGAGPDSRFRNPTGVAVDRDGVVRIADSDNYLVRRLTPPGVRVPPSDVDLTPVPWLTPATLGGSSLPWPLLPQDAWHEVTATLGEARGGPDGDGRARLHTGIDIRGDAGDLVCAVRDGRIARPIAAGPYGTDNEWLRVGVISYVHIRVGRRGSGEVLDPGRFSIARDATGTPVVVRLRRGTRVRAGDPLGTLNRLAHVHLDVGAHGAELNPLSWSLAGFDDSVAPTIAPNGIALYGEDGERLVERQKGRLVVRGRVSIVVEAFDRVDGNSPGRRLGVYALGYQVRHPDGTPVRGFDEPRMTIEFNRLPPESEAPWLAYAEGSGITVYGNRVTRFRYIVTNIVRDGTAEPGSWDTSELAPGNYALRIIARDLSGNEATREVGVTVVAGSK